MSTPHKVENNNSLNNNNRICVTFECNPFALLQMTRRLLGEVKNFNCKDNIEIILLYN